MKKYFVFAIAVMVMLGGQLAASGLRAEVRPDAVFSAGSPATTNNDDSCDISILPAATLLVPYFEVDIQSPPSTARTTLWTITNVTAIPQIAHVTVWTDLSFPVLDFNIFLTGYDVQSINMYDVIARGIIAPNTGTSNETDEGTRSLDNITGNPNFAGSAAVTCAVLPGVIPPSILADMQLALTVGRYSSCGTSRIGGTHSNAIGYITIDVSSTCSTTLPLDASYYTGEILFDNVLTGDVMQVNPNPAIGNYAGGTPMVHLRAVPEGGAAGSLPGTNLPYTFYNRYTPNVARTADRRQPLPSTFAARFIEGGTGGFNTNFKVWREGVTGSTAACATYANNANLAVSEFVRFDEHENPTTQASGVIISPAPSTQVVLPETSSVSTASSTFPPLSSIGDVAGWMYLNLNNGGSAIYSSTPPLPGGTTSIGPRPSQNWVTVSMFAEGRFAVDFDATALSNGCTPAAAISTAVAPIAPAPNVTP